MKKLAMAIVIIAASSTVAVADDGHGGKKDFGERTQSQLNQQSQKWFGFNKPLAASASAVIDREKGQPASERQLLAKGLKATFVTRAVGGNGDMISFWPDDIIR